MMPTKTPSMKPTDNPSMKPTEGPSFSPSKQPSMKPTDNPSMKPTENPSFNPSKQPSMKPTELPSASPSKQPSMKPTDTPSASPSKQPSMKPTDTPSFSPSHTDNPTMKPTSKPTGEPAECPPYETPRPPILPCDETEECKAEQAEMRKTCRRKKTKKRCMACDGCTWNKDKENCGAEPVDCDTCVSTPSNPIIKNNMPWGGTQSPDYWYNCIMHFCQKYTWMGGIDQCHYDPKYGCGCESMTG